MSMEDYSKLGILPFIPTQSSPTQSSPTQSSPTQSSPTQSSPTRASTNLVETKFELINLTRHSSDRSQTPRVFRTPKAFQKQPGKEDPYGSYALVIMKNFKLNSEGKPLFENEVLNINDPLLRKAMQEVLWDCPFIDLHRNPITLEAPFKELFFYRDDLLKYSKRPDLPPPDLTAMQFFLKFIDERLGELIKEQLELFQRGEISYELLWTLYRPGSIVFSEDDNTRGCFVVHKFHFGSLSCYRWDYKGGYLGRVEVTLSEDHFRGPRPIRDLVSKPFEWLPDEERHSIRSTLTERGHKWRRLLSSSHKCYNGVAAKLIKVQEEPSMAIFRKENVYRRSNLNVNGRIMLDSIKLEKNHPGALKDLCSDMTLNRKAVKRVAGDIYSKIKYTPEVILSDSQALLCPSTTYGYSLQGNFWAEFKVDLVQEIRFDDMCFSTLQIDQERKDMVLSLIETHESAREKFRDNNFEKGLGRIFLLHGPPGCGKTLTAEAISEHVCKPLYRATTGQLGIEPSIVEENLAEVLDLAQSWRAVLLIDEADVFLAARTTESLERNAFVSIFLRLLEYYQGIMILTTNRLQDFDDAFSSRIHVDLEYEMPDEACRTAIWKGLFDMNRIQAATTPEECTRLGKDFVLNGRDIKNLFTTALAMGGSNVGGKIGYREIATLYRINSRHKKQPIGEAT